MKNPRSLAILSAIACSMAVVSLSHAATDNWLPFTTTGTLNWSDSDNWSDGVPTTDDPTLILNFNALSATTFTSNNDLGTVQINQLNLSGTRDGTSNRVITIAGGTLDFRGADATITASKTSHNFKYDITSAITLNTALTIDAMEATSNASAIDLSGAINLGIYNLTIQSTAVNVSGPMVHLTNASTISGSGDVHTSAGYNQFRSTNSGGWTGDFYVNSGIGEFNQNTMTAANALYVASGAMARMANNNITIAGLGDIAGGGGVVGLMANNNRTLTLAGDSSYTFSGVVADRVGTVSGSSNGNGLSLVVSMTGGGVQTFSGLNEYSKTTTITSGVLEVTSLANGGGTVTTAAGGAASGAEALQLTDVTGLVVGQTISITGISEGTTITAIDVGTNTITLSQATTSAVAGSNIAAYGFANGLGISSNDASNLVISNGATLRYTGSGHSTDRLFQISGNNAVATLEASGEGAVDFTNTGAITYGTGANSKTLNLAGTSTANNRLAATIGDNGANAVSMTKNGAGKWILTGANSYTGGTTINAGTLLVNNATGSGLGTGAVTVETGGILGGTGSIGAGVAVNAGGTLSPGASVESLATGAVTMNANSTFAYEVDSSVATSVGADLLVVSGNLTLGDPVTLTLTNLAASPTAFTIGTTFSLINYSGTWNGGFFTYNGTELADGAQFTAGLNVWQIDYDANTGGSNFTDDYIGGNFANITAVVPEPETGALLLVGLLVTLAFQRRAKRNGLRVPSC